MNFFSFSFIVAPFINNEDVFVCHLYNTHADRDAIMYCTTNHEYITVDVYFQGKFVYI